MAQLAERSLPILEVRGSNPVIGKNLLNIYCQLYLKDENKRKKRPGMAHVFFKKNLEQPIKMVQNSVNLC